MPGNAELAPHFADRRGQPPPANEAIEGEGAAGGRELLEVRFDVGKTGEGERGVVVPEPPCFARLSESPHDERQLGLGRKRESKLAARRRLAEAGEDPAQAIEP
jgi:hypothetical protein